MNIRDRNQTVQSSNLSVFSTRVYGWMAIGLGFTAAVAYFIYATSLYRVLMPFWWVWSLATFGIAFAIGTSINRISIAGAIALFMTYAGLEGILFGTILPAFAASYGGEAIWSAFATGGLIFAIAMCYGMFTKSDLTGLRRILSFALIGLVAVSFLFMILSFFIQLHFAHLLISYLGLAIFVGLTVYDAQTIRRFSLEAGSDNALAYKFSLIMALKMYINVVMIFWYLLQIFSSGNRR